MQISAIWPAVAGYLFTYFNTKTTDERKAQIDRANDQVRLLYGPLLACISASRAAYSGMVRQHSPDGTVGGFSRAIQQNPSGPEAIARRHWMRDVLQPLNEKAADIVINHTNLLESSGIDPVLLQFVAHVSAYRVILRQWEEGALSERSAVPYPDKLPEYVEREFVKIKNKQAELLGIKKRKAAESAAKVGLKEAAAAMGPPPRAKL